MVSVSHITVRYQETDQMGIVHHSVYPIWYEVARNDFCKQSGVPYAQMEKQGILTPIYELRSKYQKPAHYDDILTIETRLTGLTPFRVVFSYRIYNGEALIHSGETVHVWVDQETFKPMNLQKKHPQLYQTLYNTMEQKENSR